MYVIIHIKKSLLISCKFFNTQHYNLFVKVISKFLSFIFIVMSILNLCATGVTFWNKGLNNTNVPDLNFLDTLNSLIFSFTSFPIAPEDSLNFQHLTLHLRANYFKVPSEVARLNNKNINLKARN